MIATRQRSAPSPSAGPRKLRGRDRPAGPEALEHLSRLETALQRLSTIVRSLRQTTPSSIDADPFWIRTRELDDPNPWLCLKTRLETFQPLLLIQLKQRINERIKI